MIFHDIVKNLLVLVDFSDASIFIVKKAAELAQELSARIVLLHIVEPRVVPPPVRDTGRRITHLNGLTVCQTNDGTVVGPI